MMSAYCVLSRYCGSASRILADNHLQGDLRFSFGYICGCLDALFQNDLITFPEYRAAYALAKALNTGMIF